MNASAGPMDTAAVQSRARRAYEASMVRLGALRGAVVTMGVALLALTGVARLPSPLWLAPIFLAWLFVGWRGALLWRGAVGGLVAGLGALALPLSVLRPCCAKMTSATGCSMPQLCVGAGVVLGLVVAAALPRLRSPGEWARASAGALIAVTSLVACRCASLFLGESLGVMGGLLASATGLAFARAWWSARRAGINRA